MKQFVNSRFLITICLLILGKYSCAAQKKSPLKIVPGYGDLIKQRRNHSSSTTLKTADDLLKVVLDSKELATVVPLLSVEKGGDTMVLFFDAQDLRNISQSVSILDGSKFKHLSFFKINKNALADKKKAFYDSVYARINENIMINSSIFDFEKFADSNVDSYCCRPSPYEERLKIIYLFFINGLLVREERSTGNLFYLSY